MGRGQADCLIEHAAELLTCRTSPRGARGEELRRLEIVSDGAVAIRDGLVVDVGATADLRPRWDPAQVLDATGRLVTPAFVDAHSHLLHGGSRHQEWEDRVLGRPTAMEDGIRATVRATRYAADDELRSRALVDLDSALSHGTATFEAKSGYGLDRETELRLLALMGTLEHPVDVVPTFLGAHMLAPEFADDRSGYVELVLELLPTVARLAEYCDVTCDPTGFTAAECRRIGAAAIAEGLRLRVHADQTGWAGGARLAVELEASSADHLDCVSADDIASLAGSRTVGILLPGVTYHLLEMTAGAARRGAGTNAPRPMPALVRELVDAGVCLALATDYNPGSSPTLSMQTIMQLAARLYRLSYAEIWHMSTINGAHALDRSDDRGSLETGKLADLVIWRVSEHGMVINRFGDNFVDTVLRRGELVVRAGVVVAGVGTP